MRIWVDADACPVAIKEVIFRAAKRTQILTTLIANQYIKVPSSPHIKSRQVSQGFDVADNLIVEETQPGDLVITADIPLAAEVLEKGGLVINPRGEKLTADNIGPKLNMRDFMETMRSSGMHTGGPAPLNQRDIQKFSNAFDALITQALKPAP